MNVHENLFGVHSYTHCYRFADPETFETIPFTLEMFKNSSILVHPDVAYTDPINEKAFPSTGRSKPKAPKATLNVGRTSSAGPSNLRLLMDDAEDEEDLVPREKPQHAILVNALASTIKYLVRQYNHLIEHEKILYKETQDEDGRPSAYLIFPLSTKECHFLGRAHQSNNQYLRVDKDGSRQQCHDCSGNHKHIRPGRFPNNVKEELNRLEVIRADVLVKKQKKEVSEEQRMTMVDELVQRVRTYYPKNDLEVDRNKVVFNEIGVYIPLRDLWCEVCKKTHDRPCTHLHATETGKMYLKCEINPAIDLFYPNPPLTIDPTTRQFFFSNCNISFLSQNIIHNNYGDSTGDVSIDFEEEPIFEDETLNHLIYESLASTSWPIVKVIHHLGKHKFNCTKGGEWFSYKNHRWYPNSESSNQLLYL